jgi:peptide-methionine (S)-S-oxide reductase
MQRRNTGILRSVVAVGVLVVVGMSCGQVKGGKPTPKHAESRGVVVSMKTDEAGTAQKVEMITLGAGCFWCTEAAYQLIDGVTDVQVGYTGGLSVDPSYKQVCSGETGHAEVAQITFDPSRTSLAAVLDVFWKVHDPTTPNQQGGDIGSQYRSAIFYHSEAQEPQIKASLKRAQKELKRKIVTQVEAVPVFYAAETYHQDYYVNNPDAGYCRAVIAPKLKKVRKLIEK